VQIHYIEAVQICSENPVEIVIVKSPSVEETWFWFVEFQLELWGNYGASTVEQAANKTF
jgi:hypothetical protein